MSVRRRVLLLSIIFSALGISVSIILIALAGGFSGSRSSILNPPRVMLRFGLILVNFQIPTGMSMYQLEIIRIMRTSRYYYPKMNLVESDHQMQINP